MPRGEQFSCHSFQTYGAVGWGEVAHSLNMEARNDEDSDAAGAATRAAAGCRGERQPPHHHGQGMASTRLRSVGRGPRSEEHTSELQSLMRNSYAVFCLKKK